MYKKITVFAFALCLAAFFVLAFLMPTDENASVKENRPMAEMPALTLDNIFSGKFAADFETYLSDNVGFRSIFTDIGARIEKLRGFNAKAKNQVLDLSNGSRLAIVDGKILEVFRESPTARDMYISAVNGIGATLPEGASAYLLMVPTQIEFDTSEYAELADSQKATIDTVYGALNGVTGVNVYDLLAEHTNEYIYFRTDHHWTQRGAHYGYTALMTAMGQEPVALSDMKWQSIEGFLGYLFAQANLPELEQYADNIEYFMPGENYDVKAKIMESGEIVEYGAKIYFTPEVGGYNNYGIFMGSDHPFSRVTTNAKNGKTALVIKDSYANALLPFLTSHYETIIVVDPRSYFGTLADIYAEYDVDDVIIINYAFSSTFTSFIEAMEKITD